MSDGDQRIRVAFVVQAQDQLMPPRLNSVSICTRALAKSLSARCDVRVYGVANGRSEELVFEQEGVSYHLFRPRKMDRIFSKLFRRTRRLHPLLNRGYAIPAWSAGLVAPGYALAVARDIARNPVDVIMLQHSASPTGALRRHVPDIPVIVHLHAPLFPSVMSGSYRRKLLGAATISGVSRFVAQDAAAQLGRQVCVIRNGCDLPDIDAGQRADTIVYAGAVSPEKGVHHLIEAFNEICRQHIGVRLEIIGAVRARPLPEVLPQVNEPRFEEIRPMFERDYGALLRGRLSPAAAERTAFLGQLPWEDLIRRIAAARIFVFPSVCDEGFGLPPLEAMATGTVPVVSDVGGLPEVVEDNVSGFVVRRGQAAEIAKSVMLLLEDRALWTRMSEAGRNRARAEFTWDMAAEDFLGIAERLRASQADPLISGGRSLAPAGREAS